MPRDFDFYELYPAMSRHLIDRYVRRLRLDLLARPGRVPRGPCARPLLLRLPASRRTRPASTGSGSTTSLLVHRRGRPEDVASPRAGFAATRSGPTARRGYARGGPSGPTSGASTTTPSRGRPAPRAFNLRHYPMRSPEQWRPDPARPGRPAPREAELPLREHGGRPESLRIPAAASTTTTASPSSTPSRSSTGVSCTARRKGA